MQKTFGIVILALFILSIVSELFLVSLLSASSFSRLAEDFLLITLFAVALYRFFISPFKQSIDDFDNGPSSPFKPFKHTDPIGLSLDTPVNKIIKLQETAFDDLADSVARLEPMSEELRTTL